MTLLDEAFDQRLWFTRPLSPYDMVAGPDYSGEIEMMWIKFERHGRMAPRDRRYFRIAHRRRIQRIFLIGD
jgi:hypothetical protein